MDELNLKEDQEAELHRLLGYYRREAKRCKKAKAYLAGCIMAGAELETALILMVNAFPQDLVSISGLPHTKKGVKPLLKWTLAELLRMAKKANWLPSGLDYEQDDWDHKKARVGDRAEVNRELRNLAHPAQYLSAHYRKRVTKKHLEFTFTTINIVNSWLYSRIEDSVLARMEEEKLAASSSK